MSNTKEDRSFIQSLARGLALLQALGRESRPLTLSEIAAALQTNKVTATRFCHTLVQLGFVRRDSQKRYHLTPKVLTLGYGVLRKQDWREVARYYLERLSEELRERVSLSVLDGHEILYLIQVRRGTDQWANLQIGSRLPVHCTSQGKVLLAFGPAEVVRPLLERLQFTLFTHKTIASRDELAKELEEVRARGYAINDEELSVGLRSAAAPILDDKGQAVAAVNVGAATKDYSRDEIEAVLVPRLVRTAAMISEALKAMV